MTDNGRGIPVDTQKETGKPALETVFTVLHAGGKFGGGGYKVSGGLHGVGASVVNALSTELDVKVSRQGKRYYMDFDHGHVKTSMKVIDENVPEDVHGTTVHFKPDPEIFRETTTYNLSLIHILTWFCHLIDDKFMVGNRIMSFKYPLKLTFLFYPI